MARFVVLTLGLLGAPSVAAAQAFTFTPNPQAIEDVGLEPDQVQAELDNLLGEDLELIDIDRYLDGMAEAAAFSIKGMGTDYASNVDKLMVGIGVGTAVAGVDSQGLLRGDELLPPDGYAAQGTLMAGLNLGWILPGEQKFLDRITVFGNLFFGELPSNRIIQGSLYNAGLHGQLTLINPTKAPVLQWGGLQFTSGVQFTNYTLRLRQDLPLTQDVEGVTLRWDGQGDYRLRSLAASVPIELSTNVRLKVLGIGLTAFGGVGFDITDANSVVDAELSGDVFGSVDGQDEVNVGNAAVSLDRDGLSLPTSQRAFVGAQLDVWLLKLFGHVNIGTNDQLGAHAGLRLNL